ncbi:MAG TPA: Holliday junction branch migration protein RuvA, partial [Firmicutes bacterium]|nr:Holliday junction branch migration protein RuvA [Bacillota bacterium]
MISYVKGTLVEKTPARIVVESAGVGYEILVPLSSFDVIGEVGSQVKIYTYFHVREDSHTLFGFATPEERKLFQMLISVSGIGPRSALTILSGVSVEDFCEAIVTEQVDFLTAISGIGRKTAQRLIVELKNRISDVRVRVEVGARKPGMQSMISEAVQALVSLGFPRASARKAVEKCISEADRELDV